MHGFYTGHRIAEAEEKLDKLLGHLFMRDCLAQRFRLTLSGLGIQLALWTVQKGLTFHQHRSAIRSLLFLPCSLKVSTKR